MKQARPDEAWPEIRDRIKARWTALTDVQLDSLASDWTGLTALLQREIGLSRENAHRQLQELRDIPQRSTRNRRSIRTAPSEAPRSRPRIPK